MVFADAGEGPVNGHAASAAVAVLIGARGVDGERERYGVAGALRSAPHVDALAGRDGGDDQRGERVKKPGAGAAREQADESDRALGGAQQVLCALAGGCARVQPLAEAMLGPAEPGHEHDARRHEGDRQPIALGLAARHQLGERLVTM